MNTRIFSNIRNGCLAFLAIVCLAARASSGGEDLPHLVTNNTPHEATLSEDIAPALGLMPTHGVSDKPRTNQSEVVKDFQFQLDFARKQRREKSPAEAVNTLVALLKTQATIELKRPALFELALAEQDNGQAVRAQQIFAQYLSLYPDDPSTPEVLLRQGILYRQMGVTPLAISKFYAVMSTALKLKLDKMDYYRKLVLQAQVEIADTYYLEGKYEQSCDYFSRLLKNGAEELDKGQIQFKLIRSLSSLTNHAETVAKAQVFLETYPQSSDIPEVRFELASALKKLGRNQEAMKQVLLLLQSQHENSENDPQGWAYWQRRAGNEIANQLYKEGDYLNALEIYLNLSDLDKSPAWQLPVWYQTGLVYEQLQQWEKANGSYQKIIDRRKEMTDKDSSPGLLSVFDMAGWRKDYIAWMQKAKVSNQAFQRDASTRSAAADAPAIR